MLPNAVDHSPEETIVPDSPNPKSSRQAFRNVLEEIVAKKINGEEDSNLVAAVFTHLDEEGIPVEERNDFYVELKELSETFFGIQARDEAHLTEMIRALIRTVFPDLFEDGGEKFITGDRVRILKDRINDEIRRLSKSLEEASFDLNDFVNSFLFEGNEFMDLGRLSEKLESARESTPSEIVQALSSMLEAMKGKRTNVAKKAIAGTLKRAQRHNSAGSTHDPRILQLKDLLSFIESLESKRMGVTDFHLLDYLKDYIDADTAGHLMNAKPQTLTGAVIESRYNGNHLATDSFAVHSREEAVRSAVISSMTPEDFQRVMCCLIGIVKGESTIEDLNLRTGIGAFPDAVPLRILSYVIPALTIASRLKKRYGKSPKIDFFTGQEGGIACNNMPADLVRKNTMGSFRIVHQFVQTFFPDVAEHFSLVEDKEWAHPQTQLMVDYLERLLVQAIGSGDDPYLEKIATELKRRGSHYGGPEGERNSLKYAAFHAICFRDIPTINAYIDGNADVQSHIISIGGPSETEFDHVRNVLATNFSTEGFNQFALERGVPELSIKTSSPALRTRSSLIANTGIIPPYFLVREAGDITLTELDGMEPDQMRALFADRIQQALTRTTAPSGEGETRITSGAKSFVQGMALIAVTTGRESLVHFIHTERHAQ